MSCPDFRRGITLLEMIVVVAIIGLIVGLSFPSVTAGLDSVRMVSAADSVAVFLNGAVTRAERKQQAVELVISPTGLMLYSSEPGFTRELKLPEGIVVESVTPAADELSGDTRRFMILPGGTVPGVGIQLVSKRDNHRLVRLDPMTGFPHVEGVSKK